MAMFGSSWFEDSSDDGAMVPASWKEPWLNYEPEIKKEPPKDPKVFGEPYRADLFAKD